MVVPRWACEVNIGAKKVTRNDVRPKTRDNTFLMQLHGGGGEGGSPQYKLKKNMTMGRGHETTNNVTQNQQFYQLSQPGANQNAIKNHVEANYYREYAEQDLT